MTENNWLSVFVDTVLNWTAERDEEKLKRSRSVDKYTQAGDITVPHNMWWYCYYEFMTQRLKAAWIKLYSGQSQTVRQRQTQRLGERNEVSEDLDGFSDCQTSHHSVTSGWLDSGSSIAGHTVSSWHSDQITIRPDLLSRTIWDTSFCLSSYSRVTQENASILRNNIRFSICVSPGCGAVVRAVCMLWWVRGGRTLFPILRQLFTFCFTPLVIQQLCDLKTDRTGHYINMYSFTETKNHVKISIVTGSRVARKQCYQVSLGLTRSGTWFLGTWPELFPTQ